MAIPPSPKIYHITHVANLSRIIQSGGLLSDARMAAGAGPAVTIGMATIKNRRINRCPVTCHPGTMVGEYVPFNFCPRSVMLYVLHCANHPELAYRGGQGPIVHLEADLHAVVRWAEAEGMRWAFSLSNASALYTQFRSRLEDLDELDWSAIRANDFRAAPVKEGKQAEFLVQDRFPWELIERIGVRSAGVQAQALAALEGAAHRPPVVIRPDWYY